MKVAVFSDVHGNLYALEAILKDIDSRSAELVFCGGDLVGYGAFPNEVIEFLRQRRIPAVMGNYDEGIGHDLDECGCAYKDEISKALGKRSIAWTRQAVTSENKRYLRGLLQRISFTVFNKKILLVHGSPRKINEYLFENRPQPSLLRLFEHEMADVIICGHTHLPYVKKMAGEKFMLINSGSAGKPRDGDPRAGYVMVNFESDRVKAEIIRVPYDVEAMAKAVEKSGLPVEYADLLRQATG